jgi:hypothetical protein
VELLTLKIVLGLVTIPGIAKIITAAQAVRFVSYIVAQAVEPFLVRALSLTDVSRTVLLHVHLQDLNIILRLDDARSLRILEPATLLVMSQASYLLRAVNRIGQLFVLGQFER